jgi:hypothetical protein
MGRLLGPLSTSNNLVISSYVSLLASAFISSRLKHSQFPDIKARILSSFSVTLVKKFEGILCFSVLSTPDNFPEKAWFPFSAGYGSDGCSV